MTTKTVDIYFDYVCPYCYIASKREAILKKDLDIDFNWKPWEIHPERPMRAEERTVLRPSFIISGLASEIGLNVTMPVHRSNSRMALLGMLYAKSIGKFDEYHKSVFRKHWEEKKDISDVAVLKEICTEIGIDPTELEKAVANPDFDRILKEMDREAGRRNVELVPSYVLDGRIVVGNIPLANLKRALEDYLKV
ncbi:MAG: DsbA family protein [Thermoplasmata archaeon]|nr:DsbA family protein [Thermoplasmata archaeon]